MEYYKPIIKSEVLQSNNQVRSITKEQLNKEYYKPIIKSEVLQNNNQVRSITNEN